MAEGKGDLADHLLASKTPADEAWASLPDSLADISVTDSTELWLIQWPINQLKPADFHGKELSLKLHHDRQLGSFESSSGKTYDVISYASQEPDATVFLPSASVSKVVGKISRRVCLVRYPEPDEFEKPSFSNLNLSSHNLEGTKSEYCRSRKLMRGSLQDTVTSAHSTGQRSMDSTRYSRQNRHESSSPLQLSVRSAERSSHASGPESQITNTSVGSELSIGEKSKKKRKTKVKAEE